MDKEKHQNPTQAECNPHIYLQHNVTPTPLPSPGIARALLATPSPPLGTRSRTPDIPARLPPILPRTVQRRAHPRSSQHVHGPSSPYFLPQVAPPPDERSSRDARQRASDAHLRPLPSPACALLQLCPGRNPSSVMWRAGRCCAANERKGGVVVGSRGKSISTAPGDAGSDVARVWRGICARFGYSGLGRVGW
ncbi:hypothetical protein M3J09_011750 [Ascochyta lentis]